MALKKGFIILLDYHSVLRESVIATAVF